jgi:hypothetical protein
LNETKSIDLPYRFFSQHNRGDNIFRADPSYHDNEPWYDWVSVQWQDYGIIPAKLLLFWQIDESTFKKPFEIGSTKIISHGIYVIAYSLLSEQSAIKAHGASRLVQYAQLDYSRDLCIISVDSIFNPMVALPYQISDNIVNATEWILLINKQNWKEYFVGLMKEALSKNEEEDSQLKKIDKLKKSRKRKHYNEK